MYLEDSLGVTRLRGSGFPGRGTGSGSRQLDCAGLGRQLQETLGSKGGGRPEMIQGSVARKREEIEGAIRSLTRP